MTTDRRETIKMRGARLLRWARAIGHSRGFGIQSPFAYWLVTEVVCGRGGEGRSAQERLKDRLAAYAAAKGKTLTDWDLALGPLPEEMMAEATGDTIILLYNLYKDRATLEGWRRIVADSRARVTIDAGVAGVVTFRSGLSKQNYLVNL